MSAAATADREFEFTERDFERVRKLIYARAGISLAATKQNMVYSRLSRRLRALCLDSVSQYLDRLEHEGGDEWEAFTNALTTNLTAFFRESHHFDTFKNFLATLPRGRRPRVWCAAASTGEEPYSIAIAAAEHYQRLPPPVELLATDVDTQVLAHGRAGVYALDRVEKLERARLKQFFRRGHGPNQGRCRVVDELRELIEFRPLNLLHADYGMREPFDVIFCRNVMIYFDKPTQRKVLERLTRLLTRDGLLFAGHSESFFHAADIVESCGRTVYRRAR